VSNKENDWQRSYQAALLEVDPAKMPERIEQAYNAIRIYIYASGQNSNGAERQALADALANLRVLRRELGLQINNSDHGEPKTTAPNQ